MAQASEEKVYLDEEGLGHLLAKVKTDIYDRVVVDIPVNNQQIPYTGQNVLPVHDDENIELVGDYSNVVVGEYTYTARLRDGGRTVWSDGTTTPKNLSYAVIKASNWLTLDKETLEFVLYLDDLSDDEVSVTRRSTGNVTVSSDSTYVTATISNDVITISPDMSNPPTTNVTAHITVYDEGDTNTNSSSSIVTVSLIALPTIVSWTNGDYQSIYNMVKAADKGLIDLYDYWNTGDERVEEIDAIPQMRSVSMWYTPDGSHIYYRHSEKSKAQPAQSITLVLEKNTEYTLASDNTKTNKFVVRMKECLSERSLIAIAATSYSYQIHANNISDATSPDTNGYTQPHEIASAILDSLSGGIGEVLKEFNCKPTYRSLQRTWVGGTRSDTTATNQYITKLAMPSRLQTHALGVKHDGSGAASPYYLSDGMSISTYTSSESWDGAYLYYVNEEGTVTDHKCSVLSGNAGGACSSQTEMGITFFGVI